MNRYLLLFILAILFPGIYAQEIKVQETTDLEGISSLPQENIYVHHNTSLLFPAEYLYYSLYCLNAETGGYSKLSKVAYIELIGEDMKPVFRHKVPLDQGAGQGDFFVPATLPTGSYKLIAYTQWMRNIGPEAFFKSDIRVINPFQLPNKKLITQVQSPDSLMVDPEVTRPKFPVEQKSTSENNILNLGLDRKIYGRCEKVTVNLFHPSEMMKSGRISVSVRKQYDLPEPGKINAEDFYTQHRLPEKKVPPAIGSTLYVPELRGELLSGRVNSPSGLSTANLLMALSLPGEEFRFVAGSTNEEGNFYFILQPDYDIDTGIIQILEPENDYHIEVDSIGSINYGPLHFTEFKLDSTMAPVIRERSIHNQIESAYFGFRPDSLLESNSEQPFSELNFSLIQLDEYIPFRTVRVALEEVVKNVVVKKNKSGKDVIHLKSLEKIDIPDLSPLILVDGLPMQDHEVVLNLDARRMKTIEVALNRFVFGPKTYQGILILKSEDGTILNELKARAGYNFPTFIPQPKKTYFIQSYPNAQENGPGNLPDDRLQLIWIPDRDLDENLSPLYFYTSDVPGKYIIEIEGFTGDGEGISLQESFTVIDNK